MFVPFGYYSDREVDYFIVHNQGKALKKLFDNGLKIFLRGIEFSLVVKLGVAKILKDQPKVSDRIFSCIQERINSAGEFKFSLKFLKII